jgi:hypothetical protein
MALKDTFQEKFSKEFANISNISEMIELDDPDAIEEAAQSIIELSQVILRTNQDYRRLIFEVPKSKKERH